MGIDRRTFVKSLSGAAAATFIASRGVPKIFGGAAEVQDRVLDALAARLPHLDMREPAVKDFAVALATRSTRERGSSVTNVSEALDPKYKAITFERFVCQEFMATTNYLEQGAPEFAGLVFGQPLAHI